MTFPIGNFTNCTGITALKTSEQQNERKNCSNVKTDQDIYGYTKLDGQPYQQSVQKYTTVR